MRRWLEWLVLVLVAGFVAAYVGDWGVYKLRHAPQGKVSVSHFLAIPLKGNKQELDYQGTEDVPCAIALFPQGKEAPCWRLRRNPNQWQTF
jgi:hypothetical protein